MISLEVLVWSKIQGNFIPFDWQHEVISCSFDGFLGLFVSQQGNILTIYTKYDITGLKASGFTWWPQIDLQKKENTDFSITDELVHFTVSFIWTCSKNQGEFPGIEANNRLRAEDACLGFFFYSSSKKHLRQQTLVLSFRVTMRITRLYSKKIDYFTENPGNWHETIDVISRFFGRFEIIFKIEIHCYVMNFG